MIGCSLRLIVIIARQELRIALRNRWVLLYAVIFGSLTTGVSYFGLSITELSQILRRSSREV